MSNYSKSLRVLISEARLEAKMSQKELAEAIGSTPALISKYESGKSKPRAETLERLAKVLNLNTSELLEANEEYSTLILIDYIVDEHGSLIDSKPYGINSSVIRTLKVDPKNTCAYLMLGDSMSPVINDGDTVMVDQMQKNIIDGNTYLINYNGLLMVKRLYKLFNGDLRVVNNNTEYPDNLLTNNEFLNGNLSIIGKAVWRGGSLK